LPETYEIREKQIQFTKEIEKGVNNNQVFIGSAPCGIGKSLAALLAILPVLHRDKLLICFRTRGQLHIYLKELRSLKLNFSAVSFFSKQDMCPRRVRSNLSHADFIEECNRLRDNCELSNKPYCRFYQNTYTRKKKVQKLASDCARALLTPMESVKRMANEGFCAYEALKRNLDKVNIFLGTYHYIFDPQIRKTLLTNMKTDISKVYLIVDEAHNLPSFARELLSSKLTVNSVRRAISETEKFRHEVSLSVREYLELLDKEIFQRAERIMKKGELKRISSQKINDIFLEKTGTLASDASETLLDYGEYVKERRWEKGSGRIFSFNYHVGNFLEKFFFKNGEEYIHLMRKNWENGIFLEVRSFDGRELTDPVLQHAKGSILMSGSLSPPKVYGDLTLYDTNRARCKEFDSPFPTRNRLILAAKDVSSKFENRTLETLNRWSHYIEVISQINQGNLAVFFTSYDLMRRVVPLKFSEGIDYPNNILTCVVTVGLPYATWTVYEKGLIDYFDHHFPEKGRLYGYVIPAVLRLVQTCGRVHRSAQDKGCIIILDERVTRPDIRRQLPNYFQKEMEVIRNPEECGDRIAEFWNLHRMSSK
jgi:DNA excision repair protein ERCC-2